MKRGVASRRRSPLLAAAAGCVLLSTHRAGAATWTFNGGGSWGVGANWDTNPNFPSAADAIADFSTLDLTSDYTISLTTGRTVGTINFGDTAPSNNWIIGAGGSLTLGG